MIKVKKESILVEPKDIKPSSDDFEVIGTINPAAIRLHNGNIMLYVRVIEKLKKSEDERYCYSPRMVGENSFKIKLDKFDKKSIIKKSDVDFSFGDGTKRLKFISHLRRVMLDKKGFKIKSIDKKPSFFGLKWDGELGVEDPRITKINNLYVMTYVSLSRKENVSTSYAISNDCIRWYRRGVIFGEQDKDVVIFPEKVRGEYVAFDRPEGSFQFSLPHIWINYSKDLEHWGESKPLSLFRKGDWDSGKNGAGPPPIKTKEGWLLLYHSVEEKERKITSFLDIIKKALRIKRQKRMVYNVGAALFDIKNPNKILAKSKQPVIPPLKGYKKESLEHKKVVFPTGLVIEKDNTDLLVYSGEEDLITTAKKVSLSEILDSLKKI